MQRFQQNIADDASVLAGGLTCNVYYSGTTILAPIYSDNGVTSITNPTTTDSSGVLTFYAPSAVYDIVVTSNRNVSKTITVALFDPKDIGVPVMVKQAIAHKSADTSRNTTVTLADDPDIYFPMGKNEEWFFRLFIDCSNAIKTTGIKIAFAGPSGSSGNFHANMITDTPSSQTGAILNTNTIGNALDFTTSIIGPSANTAFVNMFGRILNGLTSGNARFQWSQSTSSGTNLTLGAGTFLTAYRVS